MKGQNYKDFGLKKYVSLRKYSSFNDLVEFRHLDLLMSVENLQKQTMLFNSVSNSLRLLIPGIKVSFM